MTTPASPQPRRALVRVAVKPSVLRWARERSGKDMEAFVRQFPKYREWEAGEVEPTYRQLKRFAKTTYTPFGVIVSGSPMADDLPIADFRTVGGRQVLKPSPHLLDTVYLCQSRQDWYHEYALAEEHDPVELVGSATLEDSPVQVARDISSTLDFRVEDRRDVGNWSLAVRRFANRAEDQGVLVMISGVVGNDTSRKLDSGEFRGFALSDDLAPLVFVNGADAKAAQMFTLAHELAHIWLGNTGLSNVSLATKANHQTEKWCNQVAAELLVPLDTLREQHRQDEELKGMLRRLAAYFKVSSLVVLRRLLDAGYLSHQEFQVAYDTELQKLSAVKRRSGGNFYLTQTARVGRRFASDLVADTLRGRTRYTEAFHLLAIAKTTTFRNIASELELVSKP